MSNCFRSWVVIEKVESVLWIVLNFLTFLKLCLIAFFDAFQCSYKQSQLFAFNCIFCQDLIQFVWWETILWFGHRRGLDLDFERFHENKDFLLLLLSSSSNLAGLIYTKTKYNNQVINIFKICGKRMKEYMMVVKDILYWGFSLGCMSPIVRNFSPKLMLISECKA